SPTIRMLFSFSHRSGMRSVPPRGSGWVLDSAEDLGLTVKSLWAPGTHALPRGGTDLMPLNRNNLATNPKHYL
ncbi:MAG: hypothetical protein ABJB21_10130, partial [bacterium]